MLALVVGIGGRQVFESVDAGIVGLHVDEAVSSRTGHRQRISLGSHLGGNLVVLGVGISAHPNGVILAHKVLARLGVPAGIDRGAHIVAEAVVAHPRARRLIVIVLLQGHGLAGKTLLAVLLNAVVILIVPHGAGDGRTRHLNQAHIPVLDALGRAQIVHGPRR